MIAAADSNDVRPAAWSKSMTLSTIAAAPVPGSWTTWVAVKVGSSKKVFTTGARALPRSTASTWS